MLKNFLEKARADETVFITDVREEFLKEGTRPFHLHVEQYDGSRRRFEVLLPETETDEEERFAASYVHALISNILSSLGAVSIEVYIDPDDAKSTALAAGLDKVFQSALPRTGRSGYGRYMNVNERVVQFLSGGQKHFAFKIMDCRSEEKITEQKAVYDAKPVFSSLPERAMSRRLLGIDIGGTDIKLVSSYNGNLALCKEFDWFPASYTRAELLIDPVLMLVRLMRAGTALVSAGMEDKVDKKAFSREASADEMQAGILAMEAALKFKEISYLPCEAYAAGELKHGPIALINNGTPVIAIMISRGIREIARLMAEEMALEMGKTYLGIYTFVIRPAFPTTDCIPRVVDSET